VCLRVHTLFLFFYFNPLVIIVRYSETLRHTRPEREKLQKEAAARRATNVAKAVKPQKKKRGKHHIRLVDKTEAGMHDFLEEIGRETIVRRGTCSATAREKLAAKFPSELNIHANTLDGDFFVTDSNIYIRFKTRNPKKAGFLCIKKNTQARTLTLAADVFLRILAE
jgi:hypothetical protein